MEPLQLRIAVVGGDPRQAEVAAYFVRAGHEVRVAALPWEERMQGARDCLNAADAFIDAHVVILPVQGVDEEGRVFTEPGVAPLVLTTDLLRRTRPGAIVFTGIASRYLAQLARDLQRTLVPFREADEFAIYNAVPSAEGAVQMAMEAAPFTIAGSRSLVLGYGRTGFALARLLSAMQSETYVAARKLSDLAYLEVAGHKPVDFAHLTRYLPRMDLIFNTVPKLVLDQAALTQVRKEAVIIDLASAPGGTDFAAAAELGIKALLAPGLPGRVAPVTAGNIIARTVAAHLELVRREGVMQDV
jgi:dipicolinate synthase subunit A